MPDAVETAWQHMQQKAPDELVRGELHGFVPLRPIEAVVLVFEGYSTFTRCDQAAVGDGHAMGVAGKISQDRFGAGKRFFRVDHPFGAPQRRQEGFKDFFIGEVRVGTMELEAPFAVCFQQHGKHKAPEQPR